MSKSFKRSTSERKRHLKINTLSIGLELEANVVDLATGKPVTSFNNSEEFSALDVHLQQLGFLPLQTEFDAATIEFSTSIHTTVDAAFTELRNKIQAAQEFLARHGHGLLFAGLHPGRGRDDLYRTHKLRCVESLPLMAEKGGPLFYCGFQINFGFHKKSDLLRVCQLLQIYMWPLTAITQASPLFAWQKTNYKCYRICLNDAISSSRAGILPPGILSWEDFTHYCRHLPGEEQIKRKNNVWFDIFPKTAQTGYRIEIRAADTTGLSELYAFTQAMTLTFMGLRQQELLPYHWLLLNRDQILKLGNQALLTVTGKEFLPLPVYLQTVWRPLVTEAAYNLNIDLDALIGQLTADSRADGILQQFSQISQEELVLSLVHQDEIQKHL